MSWARVPTWLSRRAPTDRAASDVEAWTDLLCRWQEGENPGPRELMRAWTWGAGRTSAFIEKARTWALENGARCPDKTSRNKSEQQRNETEQEKQGAIDIVDEERNVSTAERNKTERLTRARSSSVERETIRETQTDPEPPPPGGSPPPPDPEAHHAPSPLPSPGGDPAPLDTPRGADADPEPGEPAPADAPVGDVRADVEAGRDIPGRARGMSPRPEAVPAWTPSAAECRPHPRQAVAEMVLRSLEAIRQRPVSPERCGTDAKPVLGLWRALGKPDPAEFAAELALVAEAARECPAPLFARSLRAEGWAEGTDRSRSVATLCRREPWGDRLEAARAWRGQPTTVAVPEPDAPPSRAMLAWRTLEAIKATGKRSGDPLEAEAIAVARELDLFAALRASPLESLGPTRARFLANFHHAEAAK